MRQASAASMKGIKNCPTSLRPLPHVGSQIGDLYDLLMANKGAPVAVAMTRTGAGPNAAEYLRNFYGLDIRCIRNREWVLAGEWFGRVYIDYIAERLEANQ